MVNCVPIKEKKKRQSEEISQEKPQDKNDLQTRAGILDVLKPSTQKTDEKDKENNKGPLQGAQNLLNSFNIFNNTSNNVNALNPLQSLLSGNGQDGAKVFLLATQGIVFPLKSILGGFNNMLQGLSSIPKIPKQ